MEKEIWLFYKDTRHNHGGKKGHYYEVSNFGRVKEDGKIKVFNYNIKGYLKICGEHLHVIVARLFVYNDDPIHKTYVDHIDTNIYNNRADNLRWVTASGNANNPLSKKKNRKSHLGKTQSEHSRKLISEHNHNKLYGVSDETRIKMRNSALGKVMSDEAKKKNSEKHLGSHWMNNGFECHYILPQKIQTYLDLGYVFGRI